MLKRKTKQMNDSSEKNLFGAVNKPFDIASIFRAYKCVYHVENGTLYSDVVYILFNFFFTPIFMSAIVFLHHKIFHFEQRKSSANNKSNAMQYGNECQSLSNKKKQLR